MQRWRELIVVQWALLLALVVALPWGGRGFLLTYDMVWVPRWELSRDDLWGLGTALPRAVPSDAVVAVLSTVLDPALLQRLVLIGAMVLGGVGAARLVDHLGLAPRLVAATYALWNPFVAERLVLGQWPVLVALGCLPWIAVALRNPRDVRWATLTLALAGTALSAATGVMGLVAAVVLGLRAGAVRIAVLAALVNAPWVVAGVVHAGALASDPSAVRLFDAQPEGPFGRLGAVLALGGVWNTEVVPTSRTTVIAAVLVALMWAVMLVGAVAMWRTQRVLLAALGVLGAVGLAVACWGWLAPDLLEDAIRWRPEVALLRDGTRYLALLVPLQVVTLAHGVAALTAALSASGSRARDVWWRLVPAGIVLALPIAALPDLAHGVANRVTPVEYPADWREARSAVAASPVPGDLLVLPFSAYRAPEWNEGRTVLAPAGRYFDRTTVVDDRLPIAGQQKEGEGDEGRVVAGEDLRAARIAALLEVPTSGPAQLAAEGIGLVVLEPSGTATATAPEALPPVLAGARELPLVPDGLRVFEIDGAVEREVPDVDRYAVTAAWGVAAFTVGLALLVLVRRGGRRLLTG